MRPVMGPAPALLDRRLLFFTGKGGVGKSTVTAATALLAAEQGKRVLLVEVDAKNNLTALFEHPAGGLRAAPGPPRRLRDADGHRGVAARVPEGAGARPGVRSHRTVGPCVRFRRDGCARREGDPHRRQGVLGAARVDQGPRRLGPHRRRRGRDRPRDQPARRPRRDPGAGAGRPGAQPDRLDGGAALRSRAHRAQRGDHGRGDAGERDDRARGACPSGARRAARASSS